MTQPFSLGTYIWITTNDDIEVIKRFEEQTETHLICDRGRPIPLSNIKRVRQARGLWAKVRATADEWNSENKPRPMKPY